MRENNGFVTVKNTMPNAEWHLSSLVMHQIGPMNDRAVWFVHARPARSEGGTKFTKFIDPKRNIIWNMNSVELRDGNRLVNITGLSMRIIAPLKIWGLTCDHSLLAFFF